MINPPTPQSSNTLASDLDHILSHTEGLWDELRGKRIFITGGTGFFGKWLLESFIWVNDRLNLESQMVVLSRAPSSFEKKYPHFAKEACVTFCQGDVRNFDFPNGQFDFVIHAATDASARINAEDPLGMVDTIVEGTRHALDFAVRCKAKKFLLTSSGAVYGKQPSELTHVSEDYCGAPNPLDPSSAYGEGKRAAELLCALYSKKYSLDTKIARCFAFVGPYLPLDIHYAVGNFIRDGLAGGPIQVSGDGTPYRSYLYAADLTVWLWTILFKGESCRPYNVGSEEEITITELANVVAQSFEKPIEVRIAKSPIQGRLPERYVPSTKRVCKECEVRQRINLKESLNLTIQQYLTSSKPPQN
jgi:nucleoside-diphosphate-sugar epimerase